MPDIRSVARPVALALVFTVLWQGSPALGAGLEEVIVTAQKREQGLQDVPVAVEAFSRAQIDNLAARDISDLSVFTPNVSVTKAANQPNYFIRGIGTRDFGVGADPAVGVYQDGVYIGRSGGSQVAFNDVERVEILNGPQGTLFGRNAAAGAIQYVTHKPEEGLHGWVRGITGDYDRYQVDGVANVPLTDDLFFRAGALWNQREGWVDNTWNGDDLARLRNMSLSLQLRWLPTENLDTNLRLEYDITDQDPRVRSSAVWGQRDNGAAFNKVQSDSNLKEQRDLFGASYHLSWDQDWATLVSITSWRQYETRNPEEKDGSAEVLYYFNDLNKEKNQQFGQELRLDSNADGRFRWTAGLTYYWENARQTSGIHLTPYSVDKLIAEREIGLPYDAFTPGQPLSIAFAVLPVPPDEERAFTSGQQAIDENAPYREKIRVNGHYHSYAGFADMTYDLTDTLSLTGGVRYTYDDKEFARYVRFNDYVVAFAFPTETRINDQGQYDPNGRVGWLESDDNWSKLTPRAVLQWQPTDDHMFYVSYSEGYKAGGFNSTGEILAPSFDPEEVDTWEAGAKTSWFDDHLRVNGAVFSYDYNNLQTLEFIEGPCLPGSSVGTYLFETSDVEGDGYEINASWLATPNLQLFANTGYLDATYKTRNERKVIDGECVVIDRSGETFSESPKLNFTVGGTYTLGFSNGAELEFFAAYNFSEGLDRNSCTYVVNNKSEGRSSDVYGLTKVDGELIISDPSATGDLIEPPYNECPKGDDFEQLNARITYTHPGGAWQLAGFVTNATNWKPDHVDPGGLGGELASNFSDGSPSWGRTEEPRMYGVEFRYNFN